MFGGAVTLASKSLAEHLVRGLLGFTALVGAVMGMLHGSLWSIPLAALGVVLLRGCPTCWMIGLMETVTARSTAKLCSNRACDISPGSGPLAVEGLARRCRR
jgi:hypothetical protein